MVKACPLSKGKRTMLEFLSNAANGYAAHNELERLLRDCLSEGYLAAVIKEYRIGRPGFSNPEQFYAPFLLQFNNRERWIVYSTTSCRTDRIKGQQWDADNLKNLDPSITFAYLVYPDDALPSEIKSFVAQQGKYDSRWEYSRIDEIMSISELIRRVRENDNRFYVSEGLPFESNVEKGEVVSSDKEERSEIHRLAFLTDDMKLENEHVEHELPNEIDQAVDDELPSNSRNLTVADVGREWDMKGRSFESDLAIVLSDVDNLACWKRHGAEPKGRNYSYFHKTLNALGFQPQQVVRVSATSSKEEIGLLPSGGPPKTDVLVDIQCSDGSHRIRTISCKRTNRNEVSVHQYSADSFADVLNPNDLGLRHMLKLFQMAGSVQNMPVGTPLLLTNALHPYLKRLCIWVLSGKYGSYSSPNQLAQYVALYRPYDSAFVVHDVETYVNMLLAGKKRMFGTPFGWTYASGCRTRNIQLKVPVLLD